MATDRAWRVWALTVLLALQSPALAAGGAHVVDDSEVETPGGCHLETWATRRSRETGIAVAAPACTPKAAPWLELGAAGVYGFQPRSDSVVAGPAIKFNLRPASTGVGVGIDAAAAWSSVTDRVETGSLTGALTLAAAKTLTVNLNGGAVWTRTGTTVAGFYGAQLVWQAKPTVGWMIEAFDRTDGDPGAQAGVRWTPVDSMDVDLLVSHGFDGTSHANATVGVTKRF